MAPVPLSYTCKVGPTRLFKTMRELKLVSARDALHNVLNTFQCKLFTPEKHRQAQRLRNMASCVLFPKTDSDGAYTHKHLVPFIFVIRL